VWVAVTVARAVAVAVCTGPSSGRGDDGSVISNPIEIITTEKTFREPVKFGCREIAMIPAAH
jgi:hypothetical protein